MELHLVNARQALPFVEELSHYKSDISALAQAADLDVYQLLSGEGLVPELNLWRFVDLAAEEVAHTLFGFHCANNHPITSKTCLGGLQMSQAETLGDLLRIFIADAKKESTASYYQLVKSKKITIFQRAQPFKSQCVSWQVELYVTTILIQIIRLAAGNCWWPRALKFSASSEAQSLPHSWGVIDVDWGADHTALYFESKLLDWPVTERSHLFSGDSNDDVSKIDNLKAYCAQKIRLGSYSQSDMALDFGISHASLKRKLDALGTCFRDLIDNAKMDYARILLQDPTKSIQQIAVILEYRHAANFSRAFRKFCGVSPMQFRFGSYE